MPSPYVKDERVLCFHHEILYEAKILDVRHQDPSDKKSPMEYKVHYKGWKSTWDDWVLEDRLRKWNEQNRELATNIRREAEAAQREKNNAKSASKKRAASDNDSVRGSEGPGSTSGRNKRSRDNEIETVEAFHARPSIYLNIPVNLRSLIVDDWERCTKDYCIVKLPAPENLTVEAILNDWMAYEHPKCNSLLDRQLVTTTVKGITVFFCQTVERILLYRVERPQKRLLKKKYGRSEDRSSPEKIWGAEHLIRLFSVLPELMAQTNVDANQLRIMSEHWQKLLAFVSQNSDRYFRTEYFPAEELSEEKV
ncbi:hypothetical protein N7468_008602 [Penicillium chermesinum]|uniref:Chromatin modification-related protein EAF3 n=1 Tax=Penicillium chermesinum TaxID=63820 RepID=A0A9W9TK10_9EURO|nr:uncharacterized protein N7468_008602 [Penicillium chermesinum]KAJ5224060.1 hypothetical protein N7468_008602 [Penicillium chermesinum]KAJ6155124.1 hypothetical protein N7470_005690 [Penicillium chermesinum]